ncbi:MAG: hypothetical protein WBN90_01660 [Gammaproteobacteria bacterium]
MIACTAAQAELINYQEAIEASDIKVSAWSTGKGHVKARSCSTCKQVKLDITPDTIIFVDGKRIVAGYEISKHWSGGLVIYDVQTKQVVKLEL